MSPTRVPNATWSTFALSIDLIGSLGETVFFGLFLPLANEITVVQCAFRNSVESTLKCDVMSCRCS